MAARKDFLAGTSTTLSNDVTTCIKQSHMAMLPHLSARTARLQSSIMVGAVLRENGGS